MKIPAWSFSSLDTFVSCARKFHALRVTKEFKEEETAAMRLGTAVHKHFEDRVKFKRPLPPQLAEHEPYVQSIEAFATKGVKCERKVGLNKKLEPCGFFDNDVWWRGVLDVHAIGADRHRICDYKTGKPKNAPRQLHLFAIYAFLESPDLQLVETEYYWTQTRETTPLRLPRSQLPHLLKSLMPDLSAYRDAFKLDVWPPKPSGLCQNYCPVIGCEFHGTRQRR
jgi:hypothetical protein